MHGRVAVTTVDKFCSVVSAAMHLLAGSPNVNAQCNPTKPHRTLEGFKNDRLRAVVKLQGDFFRWQYLRLAVSSAGKRLDKTTAIAHRTY